MKNTSKSISFLFLLGGVGIIVAIFFLLLKDYQKEDLFYLNLVATCLLYSILFVRGFDILGSMEKVAKSSSGYGLKWYGVWLYTPVALALIICSIFFGWGFNFCLIAHSILLFVLLGFFFAGSLVSENVNEVIDTIETRKAGLKEISKQIDLLEMHCKLSKEDCYQLDINKLRESIRFITASENPSAVSYDNMLIEKIRLMVSQIERHSQPADVIRSEFEECMAIIELRKKQI